MAKTTTKKRKCGKCGGKGHYRTTCKKKAKKKRGIKKKAKKKKATKKKATKKKSKKTTRRPMSRAAKIGRWGKVVGRYKSRTSNKTYSVRKKDGIYSCNCPGWVYKKKGKSRSCRHIKLARATGKRGRKRRKLSRRR